MARKIRNSTLESRSARLKLSPRRKPYTGASLGRGIVAMIETHYSKFIADHSDDISHAALHHDAPVAADNVIAIRPS